MTRSNGDDAEVSQIKGALSVAIGKRFELHELAGQGANAFVFEAVQIEYGRKVAIKVLKPTIASTMGEEGFTEEFRTIATLAHPTILSVFESGVADNLFYSVMQWADGGTLQDLLDSRSRLPVSEALAIATTVAEALDYAHRKSVVHRDVKPGNILFHDGHPLLADFGLAKPIDDGEPGGYVTLSGLAVGTPQFMSPEQVLNEPFDGRGDIYSLGCVLYAMLTGAPPFTNRAPKDVLLAQVNEAPRALSTHGIDDLEVESIVSISLEKNRERRFASAREFIERCHRVRTHGPVRVDSAPVVRDDREATHDAHPAGADDARADGQVTQGRIWHLSDLNLHAALVNAVTSDEISSASGRTDSADAIALRGFFAFVDAERKKLPVTDPSRDVVVITGNIVRRGETQESARTIDFLQALRSRLGIDAGRIFLVPGVQDLEKVARTGRSTAKANPLAILPRRTFVAPAGAMSAHSLQDLGLVMFLSNTESVRTHHRRTHAILNEAESVIAGPRVVYSWIRSAMHRLAGRLATDDFLRAVKKLARSVTDRDMNAGGPSQVPPSQIGVMVSHLPLFEMDRSSASDSSVGAAVPLDVADAKKIMYGSGVLICLHGSACRTTVHRERLRARGADFDFACVGAPSLTAAGGGFNIVKYGVWSVTGEARVLVQPMRIEGGKVISDRKRHIAIPARRGGPARMTRLTEELSLHGDAQTDVWVSEMQTGGWDVSESDGSPEPQRVHDIGFRFESAIGSMQREPTLMVLHPPGAVRARFVPTPGGPQPSLSSAEADGLGTVRGTIHLETPEAVDSLSLAWRMYSNHDYSMSLMSRIRCRSPRPPAPGVPFDYEALLHFVREPTSTLEMLVRFPTAAPTADEIEIRTYVEGANKSNEPAKSLRDLSGYSVDAWPEAGQLRATIENPLHGVGYGLLWKLPVTDPGLPDDQGRGEIGDAIDDAETLRTRLLEIRKSEERWTELLNTIVDPFRNSLFDLLRRSSVDFDAAQVELVISLPSLPHLAILDYKGRLERQENMGLPTLRAFWANFDDSDPRFGLELPVPRSVSGRAYASNQIAEHLSPQLARAKAKHGEGLEPYWTPADPAGKPMQRHSILYAVPIRHWSVETVVMGSLSVGSFDLGSSLDLLRNDPAQTEKTLAAESAMYLVQLLGRNLWEFTNSRMP